MRILQFVSHRTFTCTALGLLALSATQVSAGPLRDQRRAARSAASAAETSRARAVETSRGAVLGIVMSDHFRPGQGVVAPDIQPESRRDVAHPRSDSARSRRAARASSVAPIDLPATLLQVPAGAALQQFEVFSENPVAAIPEPGSTFLYAAGAGLVALIARRKRV